jgi:hypothetical protein
MLERQDYELMAKYDASENVDFDADELAAVCGVLNLHFTDFTESRFSEYRTAIVEAIHEQNKGLTELSEYLNLDNQGLRVEALRYLVQNIAKIKSPFMLDILVGAVGHRADSPLNYGRNQRLAVEIERSAKVEGTGVERKRHASDDL